MSKEYSEINIRVTSRQARAIAELYTQARSEIILTQTDSVTSGTHLYARVDGRRLFHISRTGKSTALDS